MFTSVIAVILLFITTACWDSKSTAPTSGDPATETSVPPAGNTGESPSDPSETASPYSVIAEHLRIPWVIAIDDETIYVTEREGNIVKIEDGSMIRKPVRLAKNVKHQGEGGFLGFVLAPDFSQTGQAYAYHTYEEDGKRLNRVVLLEEKENSWEEVKAFIENIPGSDIHDGGRMAFGPDGNLYITTGDASREELAQDLDSLAGKILRMTPDGGIPQDNPFPGSYVYSYGHRNPQGIAWTSDGKMYASEHGPSGRPGGHDEINLITAGSNYGWPEIIGDEQREGMVTPVYHTGDEAIAPSGVAMDSEDRLLVATLRGERLYRFDTLRRTMEVVFENAGRLRDVKIHNDQIYVITNNTDGRGTPSPTDDRLLRLK